MLLLRIACPEGASRSILVLNTDIWQWYFHTTPRRGKDPPPVDRWHPPLTSVYFFLFLNILNVILRFPHVYTPPTPKMCTYFPNFKFLEMTLAYGSLNNCFLVNGTDGWNTLHSFICSVRPEETFRIHFSNFYILENPCPTHTSLVQRPLGY